MCKFCTAKFYYLQFDFRKKISIKHQSKLAPSLFLSLLIPPELVLYNPSK